MVHVPHLDFKSVTEEQVLPSMWLAHLVNLGLRHGAGLFRCIHWTSPANVLLFSSQAPGIATRLPFAGAVYTLHSAHPK